MPIGGKGKKVAPLSKAVEEEAEKQWAETMRLAKEDAANNRALEAARRGKKK